MPSGFSTQPAVRTGRFSDRLAAKSFPKRWPSAVRPPRARSTSSPMTRGTSGGRRYPVARPAGRLPRMTGMTWTLAPEPFDSPVAAALWRAYYTEVSDRWYLLHEGRRTGPAELEREIAAHTGSELVPPRG